MARRSVVFPLPEGPRSATTSPLLSSKETPLSTSLSPSRLCTFETISSLMEANPQPESDREAQSDQHHVDDGKGADDVDRARTPERYDERADHFGARPQQIHAGRVLAHEDEEHQQPASREAEPNHRQPDGPSDRAARGARRPRCLLQLGPDLQEPAGDEPHAAGE